MQTGETDIAADDVIGAINFQAPDEGTGTDAILVAAGIEAVSEGDFSSSSNATKLSFKTGSSEAAAEKMALSSGGLLRLGGSTSAQAAADNLVIQGAADTGMSIFSGNDGKAAVYLGQDGANNDCKFEYDNDANSLVVHTNATLAMTIDGSGIVTKPLQPAFLASVGTTQSNMAIDSNVEVAFGTEIFDQNADFASNVFTAPVTGRYQFNTTLEFTNWDGAGDTYAGVYFNTSNRVVRFMIDYDSIQNDSEYRSATGAILVDMDASDTCAIRFYQSSGTGQVDVVGESKFSGYLVC